MPDSNGYLLPNERQILLRHFAPVLILFPEQPERAPYPDDGDAIYTRRSSYHPRSVDVFLSRAKVRYRRHLLLRHPRLLFRPLPITEEIEKVKQTITGEDMQEAARQYRHDPQYAGWGEAAFRAAVHTRLVQQRLAKRLRGFDLPRFRGYNLVQWRTYFDTLESLPPAHKRATVYGRLVQGLALLDEKQAPPNSLMVQVTNYGPYDVKQTRVALQYWFQYYYDDWANRHEGDWESITLLLYVDAAVLAQERELSAEELLAGVEAREVGYASHEDGYRRQWKDVQKTRSGQPIAYIARGSSASYFAWQINGYPTSAQIGILEKLLALPGTLLRGRRILGRRWDIELGARVTGRDPKNTDWTPVDPEAADRLGGSPFDPLERLVPPGCRGIRRRPDFGPQAGQDNSTYHLETNNLFWLEMVEEYGVQWGEDYFLPGTRGPGGVSKAQRDKKRAVITHMAEIELIIETALSLLTKPSDPKPPLADILYPLRPPLLKKNGCFPPNIRSYVHTMWANVLRSHRDAWPGGPGLYLRIVFWLRPHVSPLLERNDPIFHLKTLLAQIRRLRYEVQHEGSKWDNPFAWVRHICYADTFYYGTPHNDTPDMLNIDQIDCSDVDMSVM